MKQLGVYSTLPVSDNPCKWPTPSEWKYRRFASFAHCFTVRGHVRMNIASEVMDSWSLWNSWLRSPIHHVENARGEVVIESPQNTTLSSRPSISKEGHNIIYKESRDANTTAGWRSIAGKPIYHVSVWRHQNLKNVSFMENPYNTAAAFGGESPTLIKSCPPSSGNGWCFGKLVNALPWFWVGGVSRSSKGKSMSVWEVRTTPSTEIFSSLCLNSWSPQTEPRLLILHIPDD